MNSYGAGSHVMEYGDRTFKDDKLYLYQGFDPANAEVKNKLSWEGPKAAVNQRDADLLFLWRRVFPSLFFCRLLVCCLLCSFQKYLPVLAII